MTERQDTGPKNGAASDPASTDSTTSGGDRPDPARPLSRRDFLGGASRAAVGGALGVAIAPMVVPAPVLGGVRHRAPSDHLNIAIVGAGGMGTENARELLHAGGRIPAVCDVDFALVERKVEQRTRDGDGNPDEKGIAWKEEFDRARRYHDFREMLVEEPDLDGVLIATPDHTHAVIAKAAMEAGKSVYVQKPLTWSVEEARILNRVAEETGVVTQMGNQGHSMDDGRRVNEWIQGGLIGTVREVHVWTNRPIWPQGIPGPAAAEPPEGWGRGEIATHLARSLHGDGQFEQPEGFRWDLYLGPVAEDIPFHPMIHPFNWRGWTAFGVGALGDMGAHLVDHPVWALNLGYPSSVEATSSPWGGRDGQIATYPQATTVHYEFPARGLIPSVKMNWYDGGLMPPRPAGLPDDFTFDRTGGVLYIGEDGLLIHETYGRNPRIFPDRLAARAEEMPRRFSRIEGGHEANWLRAMAGEEGATSPFSYAAPLTEIMLLGIVALRAGQGVTIEYDPERGEVTNVPEANEHLRREYREGWELT